MPTGDERKKRNDSVKGKKTVDRGQQLSDKRANQVAKGKMSYDEAMKRDKADDAKKSSMKSISKQGRGKKLNSKPIKGQKLNKSGEMENY